MTILEAWIVASSRSMEFVVVKCWLQFFYRTSAERDLDVACLSVCLSVCLYVRHVVILCLNTSSGFFRRKVRLSF